MPMMHWRKALGAVTAVLAAGCGLATALNLFLLFAPRDARYTTTLLVLTALSAAATWSSGTTAWRLLTNAGQPARVVNGLAAGIFGMMLLYFYANMGH